MSNFELMDHRQLPGKNIAHGRKEASAYNSKAKRHTGMSSAQPKIKPLLKVTNVLSETVAAGEIFDQQRPEALPPFYNRRTGNSLQGRQLRKHKVRLFTTGRVHGLGHYS